MIADVLPANVGVPPFLLGLGRFELVVAEGHFSLPVRQRVGRLLSIPGERLLGRVQLVFGLRDVLADVLSIL